MQFQNGNGVSSLALSKLYVGNLSLDVGEEELKGFFADYHVSPSTITKMVVKKGFAFVEFVNQTAADIALEKCNGKPLMNTLVRIEPAIKSENGGGFPKGRKLVQLLFSNCSNSMTVEELKGLMLESRVSVVSVEGVRSAIQGSMSFVVRVASMKQAETILAEWNNKIIQGSRIQIKIIEESFMDGAGDTSSFQNFGGMSGYLYHQGQGGGQHPHHQVSGYYNQGQRGGYAGHSEENFGAEGESDFELPLRLLIPNEYIGAIIGRGGSTIRAISKGTGARVDIFRNLSRNYEMPEKPISISGPADKASQACKKIMEIIAQEAGHVRDKDNYREFALKIFVPNSVVGRIIGKAGAVIKEIMDQTQTKIHISHQPEYLEMNIGVMRSNRIVTIRGMIEGMSQAESIISSKLKEAYADGKVRDRDLEFGHAYEPPMENPAEYSPYYQQAGHYQAQSVNNRYPIPQSRNMFPLSLNSSHDGISLSRPETCHMYVPNESVGALIGRHGSSIREIIHSSGASIKVLETVVVLNDIPCRRVVIHGGVDSLFVAEYLIYRRVIDDRSAFGNMEDPQLTIEMTVPSNLVGRLIGKGGNNIREIQRQTFCRVKFLTEPDICIPPPDEGETYVRITGTAHAYLSAQKKIRTLLVKAMNKAFSMSSGNGSRNEYTEEERPNHSSDAASGEE